ncbi:MAG: thiamine pyrophosphate-binding protein [Dehalococcoidia bacterium]|jgi:benzoylformate decarboxylase|nr:thiamine pyrophosphate-binding protein [Dehalococcoidia bacterium]
MTNMKGKKALLEMLRAEGVRHIFGNPGTSESPFIDALGDFPDLQYVLVLQEGVAIGMADGYARATGRAAFVQLHIDSGLANGISLMIDAYNDNTPMVVVSGNYDTRKLAENRADLPTLVRPVTKWAVEVTRPEQIPGVIRRAFNEANSDPQGPVYVALATDALEGEAEMEIVASRPMFTTGAPDPDALAAVAEAMAGSERAIMLLGNRVARSGGVAEAVRVAELLGLPVYTARGSEASFPTNHPQYLGALATRRREHRTLLQNADALLAVGVDVFADLFYFGDRLMAESATVIHIDSKPGVIGKSEPTDLGLLASPKLTLAALADSLTGLLSPEAHTAAAARKVKITLEREDGRARYEEAARRAWDNSPISPERLMAELAAAIPERTIVVDDASSHRVPFGHYMQSLAPDELVSKRSGAIGWGIGATLGMKLAHPDRPVLGVLGDGGVMMTVQALWTAANENIPAVIVVLDNGMYRVLKTNMDIYKRDVLQESEPDGRYLYMDFPTPFDLSVIAKGMGVHGERITEPEAIGPAVRRAFASGKPALLDVVIDGSV